MKKINEPCPENDFLGEHAELLISSFYNWTGKYLIEREIPNKDHSRSLFEAAFVVVSHNTDDDPVFNYGNRMALKLFEMNWLQFTNLPSRLSAEPKNRQEREKLLARVTKNGFIDDYSGVRISSSGKRFLVENSIVWNLIDDPGVYCGQAAVLYNWTKI